MTSDNTSSSCQAAVSSVASTATILRVWDMVNRHFESLLATAERMATKSRAESNIQSQVKELRNLMQVCGTRLQSIEAYISELHRQEEGTVLNKSQNCPLQQTPCCDLVGDWHFLYMEDNRVFGYMKLVPETISVSGESDNGQGHVKRAEFTVPLGVLREVNETSCGDSTQTGDYTLCPCCQISFKVSEFWKHALFEIAERGNRVPAWQSLDGSAAPRWIVEQSAGWSNPIYRPRGLENACEIGQSLAELNLKHFLSDYEFSLALDSTFGFLALQLRD